MAALVRFLRSRRLAPRTLLALIVLGGAVPSSVRAELVLGESTSRLAIGQGVEYLEDPDHVVSEEAVLAGSPALSWSRSDSRIFSQGYSSSSWWLRFEVENAAKRTDWLLVLDYPVLDDVRVWQSDGTKVRARWTLGDSLPFDSRPVRNRAFVLPVTLPAGSSTSFVVRVTTDSSVQMPMALWTPQAFEASEGRTTLLQGAYFGALVIIALHNLLLYFTLRERAYLFYVGYVSSMVFFSASIGGWAFQYLWPRSTVWNDQVIIVSLGLAMFFGNALISSFVGRNVSVWFDRARNFWTASSLALTLAAFQVPYAVLIRFLVPFAALISIWGMLVATGSWARRFPISRWYVASWAVFLSSTIVFVMDKYGVLPRSVVSDHALQIGVVLQIVLLSFALAERINDERTLRLTAQNAALEIQRVATARLEARVAERTRELESANARLEELSTTDQLTGLRNRRFLEDHLQREFARAVRHGRSIAVLMLDIDHFKQVNDVHGHVVGDECLREVGRRIRTALRESDLVARYGGEEFCVVLVEPSAEGAVAVAERILDTVASRPVVAERALSVTLSIGCRVGVPVPGEPPEAFLREADEALYVSKANGRARVTAAEPGSGGALREAS